MNMRMPSMKESFDTAVKVKSRHEAVHFMLNTIENELKDIVMSDDFDTLDYDTQESLVVPRAKALKYWRVQLDTFMDKNVASWINTAAMSRSKELDISLESVLKNSGVADRIAKRPIKESPVLVSEPKAKADSTDQEILTQLMAQEQ